MRGIFCFFNVGRIYDQARLDKTHDYCSPAGSYNNFPWPYSQLATIQGFLVNQMAMIRLGKGFL